MKESLKTVADWLQVEGQQIEGIMIYGVSIDSRHISEGDLFIPFRGEQVNGHRYVESAIEKGAAASLWLKDEPNPPKNLPLLFVDDAELALQQMARKYREELTCKVIGITGSNGKTSTKDLVASVLSPYLKVKKTEGNFNNELGLPLTILSLEKDTDVAVLEMGMSGFGEISFLSTLAKPDFAVITNIGEAHMQDLGSRAGIAQAKFEIIDGLHSVGKLFYDGDEPLLTPFVDGADVTTQSFGYSEMNDLALQTVETTDAGSSFTLKGLLDGIFTIPVYGVHQVKNTLAAILIAKELDLSNEQIREALQTTELTAMRMQPVIGNNGALFINDAYNAAPTSMKAALTFMKETALREKKWVVLGDMLELGDESADLHASLAASLDPAIINELYLYGPEMKNLYDALVDKYPAENLHYYPQDQMNHMIDDLKNDIKPADIVMLKGSHGMHLEKVLDRLM